MYPKESSKIVVALAGVQSSANTHKSPRYLIFINIALHNGFDCSSVRVECHFEILMKS